MFDMAAEIQLAALAAELTLLVYVLICFVDHVEIAPPGELRPGLSAAGQTQQAELGALVVGPDESLELVLRPVRFDYAYLFR